MLVDRETKERSFSNTSVLDATGMNQLFLLRHLPWYCIS